MTSHCASYDRRNSGSNSSAAKHTLRRHRTTVLRSLRRTTNLSFARQPPYIVVARQGPQPKCAVSLQFSMYILTVLSELTTRYSPPPKHRVQDRGNEPRPSHLPRLRRLLPVPRAPAGLASRPVRDGAVCRAGAAFLLYIPPFPTHRCLLFC